MNDTKSKRKHWVWLLVLAAAVVLGTQLWPRQKLPAAAAELSGETVEAFIGDLAAQTTASGVLQARRIVQLALPFGGQVARLYAQTGQRVAVGDPLLQLESSALESAVVQARQNLTVEQSKLTQLQATPVPSDLSAAEAAVHSAQVTLDALLDGPDPEQVAVAEAALQAAQAEVVAASAQLNFQLAHASQQEIQAAELALEQAQTEATRAAQEHSSILVTEPSQWLSQNKIDELELSLRAMAVQANANLAAAQAHLDQLMHGDPNIIAIARAQVALAVAGREAAEAQLAQVQAGPSAATVADAHASLAQAQADLDALQRGAAAHDVALAQAQVAQAEIALARAEYDLEQATLKAPFTGLVTAAYVHRGEQVEGVALELIDETSLQVELKVDEVDVGHLVVGQAVDLTVESWPQHSISGEVVSIAPEASDENLAASFQVLVDFDFPELPLRVGMTVNAKLTTENRQNVLLVPNRAITADRVAGRYSVTRVSADGSQEKVQVTIGLRDDQFTQILSGITAGDTLLVGDFAPPESDIWVE